MKKEEITFQESQKFALWSRLLMMAVNILFIFGCFSQIILGKPWGDRPMGNISLILFTLFLLLVAIGFSFIKMQTIVNQEGVYVKMFPFHLKYKFFSWDTIAKSYIRKYKPIIEYGGWGFRSSLLRVGSINTNPIRIGINSNVAYNMSGNIGLQLIFTNGKKLLIGTHKQAELAEILSGLGKLSE
ncbi:hypothetical protein FACS189420_7290 [Bacteroidia bacterium]|nr:hypothetical protein FACS189420_7290 [Bacteroidia bacterium]